MDKFRANTNGEREGRPAEEENLVAENSSRRVTSQSRSSQFQPDDEPGFSFRRPSVDLQTLESSLSRLGFADSSVLQNGQSTFQNQNRRVINGGGECLPHSELESQQMNHFQRLSFQNDYANGSYGHDAGEASTSVMRNNGFLNGNLGEYFPYSSRNRLLDQSPWDYPNGCGSGIINSWRRNDDFGYNHDPSLTSEIVRGSILSAARDRVSSRHLLKMVVQGSEETFNMIFNHLIVHICDLMVDPFGHDVVQLLMKKCSSEQITQIVDMVTKTQFQFVPICCDSLGTSAIQVLLRCIHHHSEDQILRIMKTISMVALQLARSNHAKHVILECFRLFTLPQYGILLEVIARNCYWIAIDQHGCCMLQQSFQNRCVELTKRLTREIINNALGLCLNSYGNYMVQYVVELDNQVDTTLLVRKLEGNYPYLSRNKYGSHVVQKLLKINYIDSRFIVSDLIREIDTLLLDPYGNYVIQTAWLVSENNMRLTLWWHIQRNIRLMRCNKFGKKILEKLSL